MCFYQRIHVALSKYQHKRDTSDGYHQFPDTHWTNSSTLLTQKSSSRTIHYDDVIMGTIASQITSLTIVYSFVYSDADQRKHQSSASLAFVRGIHQGPVNSLHKWPVTWKMSPFDDVIMFIFTTFSIKVVVRVVSGMHLYHQASRS